jgi:hypothetical protein
MSVTLHLQPRQPIRLSLRSPKLSLRRSAPLADAVDNREALAHAADRRVASGLEGSQLKPIKTDAFEPAAAEVEARRGARDELGDRPHAALENERPDAVSRYRPPRSRSTC